MPGRVTVYLYSCIVLPCVIKVRNVLPTYLVYVLICVTFYADITFWKMYLINLWCHIFPWVQYELALCSLKLNDIQSIDGLFLMKLYDFMKLYTLCM